MDFDELETSLLQAFRRASEKFAAGGRANRIDPANPVTIRVTQLCTVGPCHSKVAGELIPSTDIFRAISQAKSIALRNRHVLIRLGKAAGATFATISRHGALEAGFLDPSKRNIYELGKRRECRPAEQASASRCTTPI